VHVCVQLFNEINCRKVHDEVNVFKGLTDNVLFIVIVIGTGVGQAVIIEFGSTAFKVSPLTWDQWLICVVRMYVSMSAAMCVCMLLTDQRN
jgi:hypothetical protein